ncbi:putative uncharacterized protein [Waddlia chondrophila 2032/99]|uniref:Uncharacterized protein n=2 Tax=Waddlia chondrophila TaxID=71667 RepID=D6YWH9_WADCW|nr:glucose-6-phosphate dehydrogenase assembly protein OpcA [Waddlia chondrophila]ADI38490.1 conserved hypothetical protein [Waddlia chondrophila WSU 86-1044]CCB91572.1 putative uncharacterized protein [Waddlia chondrophila 2032/99]
MVKDIKGYLFNLIIYTAEKRRSDYFEQIVHPLIEKFPSRVIHIQCGKEELSHTGIEPCGHASERLMLFSSPENLSKIPFIVLPRLVPDLPVYLLWGDDLTAENPILPKLEKLATRLIFDTESTANLQTFAQKMLNKVETLNTEFMDISWAEIAGWRDVIAQVFNTKSQLDYLRQCNYIHIKYNQLQDEYINHDSVQAIYLQGWLAAQLEWTFKTIEEIDGEHHIEYHGRKVVLTPQKRRTLNPGIIFEISCIDDRNLKTTLTFADQQSKVMIYISTPDHCDVPYSLQLQAMQTGATAMKEMFYFRPSHHYRKMLQTIGKIPWRNF